MNDIDKWEAEEATRQLAIIKSEDAAFAALPEKERVRIIKEKRDWLEAFAGVEESEEEDEENEND